MEHVEIEQRHLRPQLLGVYLRRRGLPRSPSLFPSLLVLLSPSLIIPPFTQLVIPLLPFSVLTPARLFCEPFIVVAVWGGVFFGKTLFGVAFFFF